MNIEILTAGGVCPGVRRKSREFNRRASNDEDIDDLARMESV